jgi:glycogen debranching enzyme
LPDNPASAGCRPIAVGRCAYRQHHPIFLQTKEFVMSLEITVGPPRLAINQGHSVLITDPDGQIPWPSDKGLYFFDTRMVSSWNIYANGETWQLLNAGNITHYAARIFLANRVMLTEDGVIPAGTLGLGLSRSIDGGLHEDLDLVNHSMRSVRFNLEIAARCDFADLFEVKSEKIVRRGRIVTEWSDDGSQLSTIYRNQDFYRGVTISAHRSSCRPVYANGRISFDIVLKPGGTWHTCLHYDLDNGTTRFAAPEYCIASARESDVGQRVDEWERTVLKIRTSNEEFYRLYRQGVEDMVTLRLRIRETDHMQFVPAAGVPWFVAVFGRDSLLVSLQNALVYPDFARGALDVLGSLQATEVDNYRDAEPARSCMSCVWASSHISSSSLTPLIMGPRTRRRFISSYFTPLGAAPATLGCSSAI